MIHENKRANHPAEAKGENTFHLYRRANGSAPGFNYYINHILVFTSMTLPILGVTISSLTSGILLKDLCRRYTINQHPVLITEIP
jgi:hypothetical protein